MSTTKRVTYQCPECGSANVGADATATWNDETQDWEVSGVYDCTSCWDCGYEAKNGFDPVSLVDGYTIRKDADGFFILTSAEAEQEDIRAGSVDLEDREHWDTIEEAAEEMVAKHATT